MDLHYKAHPDSDHVAKFHGDRPRELGGSLAKVIYTTLFTTNGRKQKEKKEKKREPKQYVPYRKKKLDYDLTNIANSV